MKWLIALVAAVVLAACGSRSPGPPDPEPAVAGDCEKLQFEEQSFTVCTAEPKRQLIRLVVDGVDGRPVRDFDRLAAALGAESDRLSFALNAGMFEADGSPVGLAIAGGERHHRLNRNEGPGNFHLLPNGVFFGDADGGWTVATADAFAAETRTPDFATQSGPMLVVDGELHPRFDANGTSLHIRNGVGVDADGRAHFAQSDTPVSFGRFARLFRDRLGCRDALFLDGSVSRLWDAKSGRMDAGARVGPLLAVVDRAHGTGP